MIKVYFVHVKDCIDDLAALSIHKMTFLWLYEDFDNRLQKNNFTALNVVVKCVVNKVKCIGGGKLKFIAYFELFLNMG